MPGSLLGSEDTVRNKTKLSLGELTFHRDKNVRTF